MATYSYLRCCHRLCQKGDGLFIQESMKRIQENRVNIGSLSFPSYLFFHTSDSGQIWYLRKAVFKEYPTLLRARRMEKNSWRMLEVIGTNQLAYMRCNGAFPIWLGLCQASSLSNLCLLILKMLRLMMPHWKEFFNTSITIQRF